jgi:hypothetical protein
MDDGGRNEAECVFGCDAEEDMCHFLLDCEGYTPLTRADSSKMPCC